jgi:hypothetical protein
MAFLLTAANEQLPGDGMKIREEIREADNLLTSE